MLPKSNLIISLFVGVPAFALMLSGCSEEIQSTKQSPAVAPILFTVTIKNDTALTRTEETVTLPSEMINNSTSDIRPLSKWQYAIWDGETEIPSQAVDEDNDGKPDSLIFNTQLNAASSRHFHVKTTAPSDTRNYPKRTHAEHSVSTPFEGKHQGREYVPAQHVDRPPSHTIGDLLYRFEGPGWESDKIAYRLYFDERNVIDIFGKKTSDIVLPQVGQPGNSYHKEAPWGMDILKVGPSLGIGGVGMRVDGKVQRVGTADKMSSTITADGVLRSQVIINHEGWKIDKQRFDLTSKFSINAGSPLTHSQLSISPIPRNLVTGIVKHQRARLIQSASNSGDWSYIATFGKQSFIEDELGMAIFYKKSSLIEITEDEHNHLVIMDPSTGKLDYYFMGSWAKDAYAITSIIDFTKHLDAIVSQLNQPLKIQISTRSRNAQ